ncbi:MAG: hypothetical protein EXQ92_06330 [Alphaproteobacteria bacterium]|nr:hypothetical protein [Alphaproteobacteria bacterium]
MAHTDKWGNPVSHGSAAAIARLERAIELFAAYQADPVVELDGVLAEHPDLVMGHALRAALMATSSDKAFAGEMTKSLAAAEALAGRANERERGHIAAVRAWADGDIETATERGNVMWEAYLFAGLLYFLICQATAHVCANIERRARPFSRDATRA